MSAAPALSAIEIVSLANAKDKGARRRLALAVTELCAAQPLGDGEAAMLVREILVQLAEDAARDVRMTMATRLAGCPWAPRELVVALACDEIAIARPVITQSTAFEEADLVHICQKAGRDHRVAVAGRSDVTEVVSSALAAHREPDVLTALASNALAILSKEAMDACIDAARVHSAIHEPLSVRADLPAEVAQTLYSLVGDHLRSAILNRYQVDPAQLTNVINTAARPNQGPSEAAESEAAALVAELAQAGRLTAEFVERALTDGRMVLFDHAAAHMSGQTVEAVRDAIDNGGAWAAALLCRACGLDRSSFLVAHRHLARAGRLPARLNAKDGRAAANVFTSLSRTGAIDALRRLDSPD